jgi:16S rRNA (guanine527-N7)-methyltransferase
MAWNEAINLTALRTPEQLARNHLLDSLVAAPTLRSLGGESVLDLGSGGGFPGLPLAAVLPLRAVALVDSIGKKARFLEVAAREVTGALATAYTADVPAVTVLGERAEDLAAQRSHRETWDVVAARAVGTVAEVAELGLPLLKRGGHVVAWKHDAGDGSLEREVADAARICQAAGGSSAYIVQLPAAERMGLVGHCLVVIDKRRQTPPRYPRPAAERRRSR